MNPRPKPLPGWSGDSANKENATAAETSTTARWADALANALADLGIRSAYGVSGGAMAAFWEALQQSPIDVFHFRHECGAAFAAIEASLAAQQCVLVFTTAGPGITNAITGALAARSEGAQVIFVSACSPAEQQGRFATQETNQETLGNDLFSSGAIFSYATRVESAQQLPQILRRLQCGLASAGGFVAHLSIPSPLFSQMADTSARQGAISYRPSAIDSNTVSEVAEILERERIAIWVGFGARGASPEITELCERLGAPVFATPRGKGVVPENHPYYAGVTGLGGHETVDAVYRSYRPHRVLVLGTRLQEASTFWNEGFVPPNGFIHIDRKVSVPGMAFPNAETVAIEADIATFLHALLQKVPMRALQMPGLADPFPALPSDPRPGSVRPEFVMAAIQRQVIDASDAILLAESGNSFVWANHHLRFPTPKRYRTSTQVGSMAHAVAGVVGAAQICGTRAVALSGDGSMLMLNEISTAVRYGLPASWIVLNDGYYNMCRQGMASLGLTEPDAVIPEINFAAVAIGMGAVGFRVDDEVQLEHALAQMMDSAGPSVVDIRIDADAAPPSHGRNERLRAAANAS